MVNRYFQQQWMGDQKTYEWGEYSNHYSRDLSELVGLQADSSLRDFLKTEDAQLASLKKRKSRGQDFHPSFKPSPLSGCRADMSINDKGKDRLVDEKKASILAAHVAALSPIQRTTNNGRISEFKAVRRDTDSRIQDQYTSKKGYDRKLLHTNYCLDYQEVDESEESKDQSPSMSRPTSDKCSNSTNPTSDTNRETLHRKCIRRAPIKQRIQATDKALRKWRDDMRRGNSSHPPTKRKRMDERPKPVQPSESWKFYSTYLRNRNDITPNMKKYPPLMTGHEIAAKVHLDVGLRLSWLGCQIAADNTLRASTLLRDDLYTFYMRQIQRSWIIESVTRHLSPQKSPHHLKSISSTLLDRGRTK